MQTKKQSMIESIANTVTGYLTASTTQLIVFPLFDIHIAFHTNLLITCIFTITSFCRSYLLRRFFNNVHGEKTK